MADESLFTDQVPLQLNNSDLTTGSTAVTLVFAQDGVVKGVRFWAPSTVSALTTYTAVLWQPTTGDNAEAPAGTLLAQKAVQGAVLTPGTWNVILFDLPVAVTAGVYYRPAIHNNAGRYVARQDVHAVEIVNGNITAPASTVAVPHLGQGAIFRNGTYRENGPASAYPFSFFGAPSYYVDVVYEAGGVVTPPDDDAPAVTASVTGTARTATVTFEAESDRPVTWQIDWGDGTVTAPLSSPASRTYAADGVYGILVTATDDEDLDGSKALAFVAAADPVAGDLHPNAELVAVAFLGGLPGVPVGKVATTLPQDASTWQAEGFVQVTSVGGSGDREVALRRPVLSVDCWANAGQSGRPPWGKAAHLAETIVAALHRRGRQAVTPATLTGLPAAYAHARVLSAFPLGEPRRISNDPGSYARYTFDMEIHWVEIP